MEHPPAVCAARKLQSAAAADLAGKGSRRQVRYTCIGLDMPLLQSSPWRGGGHGMGASTAWFSKECPSIRHGGTEG
eukprot:629477-Hanusia_phi.AAC.1